MVLIIFQWNKTDLHQKERNKFYIIHIDSLPSWNEQRPQILVIFNLPDHQYLQTTKRIYLELGFIGFMRKTYYCYIIVFVAF